MKITIPLVQDAHGAVQYPGTLADWSDTDIEGTNISGEYTGSLYQADGVTKLFNWSNYVAPNTNNPVMSKLAFLSRMTQAERIGIRNAIPTDAVIADAESMLGMADSVDVSAADTTGYVGYLVSKSLLTAARAATILTP